MTISSTTSKNQYVANGINTVYAYTFKIFSSTDISILLDDVVQSTGFTVDGVGSSTGGNITFTVAPVADVIVTIKRNEPLTQEITYEEGDDFPSAAHQEGLDRSVIRDQFLQEQIERALLLPPETTLSDLTLPSPVANNLLGWNTAADNLENKVIADTIGVIVSPYISTLLDDTTAAAARTTLGSTSVGDAVFVAANTAAARTAIGGAASGANSDITALNSTTSLNTGAFAGFRNPVINGNFTVWQRGTSFSTPASASYTADKWYINYDGTGAFTIARAGSAARIDNANAEGYQFQWNQTGAVTAGTFRQVRHKIESVSTYAGKTANLSFKCWMASGTGNISVTYSQNFGTGGSPSTAVTGTIVVSTALTATGYTQFSTSVAIPSIAGKTLGTNGDDSLEIVFQLPTTGIWDFRLMDIQLEQGAVKTEFEQRPLAVEIALCERIVEKSFISSLAPAQNTGSLLGAPTATGQVLNQRFGVYVPFKTRKKAAPTITTYSPNAASANWQTNGTTPTVAVATIGEYGFYIAGTTAVTAGNDYAIHWLAVSPE